MSHSEQGKAIPTLIKERKNAILKSRGNSPFFGIADEKEGNVIALKIITASGRAKGYSLS